MLLEHNRERKERRDMGMGERIGCDAVGDVEKGEGEGESNWFFLFCFVDDSRSKVCKPSTSSRFSSTHYSSG